MKLLLAVKDDKEFYVNALSRFDVDVDAVYLPEDIKGYDGVILCGGNDVHPRFYGEEVAGSVDMDEARDEAELAVLKLAVEKALPVLGICRGHQLINTFFGGTLIQDLGTDIRHTDKTIFHEVTAEKDSIAASLYGEHFNVNTFHHQAIKATGKHLRVTQTAPDGVIEGVEHEMLPILGVQWHPERMHHLAEVAEGDQLLSYFIDLCRKDVIVLDFESGRPIHETVREALKLSPSYGNNADALYDCLTSLNNKRLIVKGQDRLTPVVYSVLSDAKNNNESLTINYL